MVSLGPPSPHIAFLSEERRSYGRNRLEETGRAMESTASVKAELVRYPEFRLHRRVEQVPLNVSEIGVER